MDVTVLVATYGDPSWHRLALDRAVPSALKQTENVIHIHGGTLAGARNEALEKADTEFVIHLDADDRLAPGYIEAMAKGSADLRTPAVSYVPEDPKKPTTRPQLLRVWNHHHECQPECLTDGNWLVIGTAVRREVLLSVGGWEEWEWSEDWAAWLRCYWQAEATVEAIPEAVYLAHRRRNSRNRVPVKERLRNHALIERAILPRRHWVVKEGWLKK